MKQLFSFFIAIAIFHGRAAVCAQEATVLIREDLKVTAIQAYAPKMDFCNGIAIVSPGAGGSERGYRYLGDALSALGYLTIVTGHQESGTQVLREQAVRNGLRRGLAEMITDPGAYHGRFMDIAAATRWANERCDATQSILIGHSMGAATAMLAAGAHNKVGARAINSFNAYIALSPQGSGLIFPENAWSDIKVPILMLTGTRDAELGGATWETRTEPFENMPAGCKWLGVIDGATHMNFAGKGLSQSVESLTVRTIGAFLEGLQRGDCRLDKQIDSIKIKTK